MNRVVLSLALVLGLALVGAPGRSQEKKAEQPKLDVKPKELKSIEDALPDSAPAKPKQPRKLLIFSKTMTFRHDSIPMGVTAITLMGKKTGAWEATHTEDESAFEPDRLKEFDGVLMLNTTGEPFKPHNFNKLSKDDREKALTREAMLKESFAAFVKGGKGLAGTHSATDTYQRWGAYNEMIGGAFVSHPWNANATVAVKNLEPKHPVNAAFEGKDFRITDEIYMFRNDTALPTDRRMLLALDMKNTTKPKDANRKDGYFAVAWLGKYGKGRTFYCSLGHRKEIYANPMILRHYLAGIQYALGDLEADATPIPVPARQP